MPDTADSRLEARFDAIDEHFAEQRQYIELAFGTLEKRIVSLDRRMNERFESINGRLENLDQRMNGRFENLDQRMNGRFENLERRVAALETGLNGIGQRFGAVERKLTQLVALVSPRRRSRPK